MYRPLSIFMLLFALGPVSNAQASILRVGVGTGCTHATIQDAINVAQTPGVQVDEVRVSRSVSWTAQALVVNTSKPVNLHGGYATCAQDVADSTATEVSGAGGSAAPVFRITANAGGLVQLRRFFITGGDVAGDGYGGGIYFRGNGGRLEVHESAIVGNTAGYGGGIYAEGLAASAHLEIGANVLVFNNTARLSGGGIYLESMTMRMAEPGSSLAFNTAIGLNERGFGGGLMVLASDHDATAFVGSGGSIATQTIASNEARYGGGVSVVTNSGSDARLHLFGADPALRTSISGNTATVVGGGIYARSYSSALSLGLASVHLWNADILANVAPDGAAAFMEEGEDLLGVSFGSRLNLNSTGFDAGPPVGLLPCPTGNHCGRIAGNETRDNGQPTAGAIIRSRRSRAWPFIPARRPTARRGRAGW